MQIQLEKSLRQFDFLTTIPYERHDLTNLVKQDERFAVRQGDLIVSSYWIDSCRKRGLRARYIYGKNKIHRLMDSHVIIPLGSQTVLLHPEHGITIIPKPIDKLNFYTFIEGGD